MASWPFSCFGINPTLESSRTQFLTGTDFSFEEARFERYTELQQTGGASAAACDAALAQRRTHARQQWAALLQQNAAGEYLILSQMGAVPEAAAANALEVCSRARARDARASSRCS